jgi:hypothetical protein
MFTQAREWLKIYFFYGIIFFCVGLVGYLLNNDAVGLNSSLGYFRRILTEMPVVKELDRWRTGREIPVFNDLSGSVVFLIYPDQNTGADGDSGELFRMRKAELESHFKKVIAVPVTEAREWDQQLVNLVTGSGEQILIGVKTTVIPGKSAKAFRVQNHLFLNIPDRLWPIFFQQAILSLTSQLPAITIHQHLQADCRFFEFIYEKSAEPGADEKVFSSLIAILERVGISGRRVL